MSSIDLFNALEAAGLPVVSATDEPGKPRQATFSETLSDEQLEIYYNIIFPYRQTQIARKDNAKNEAKLSGQLKTVTPQQAVDYVVQQITGGVSETQALATFDNAGTFSTAKPVLRNMLVGMYRTVDILKLMVRILIAIRNEIWSDLPES